MPVYGQSPVPTGLSADFPKSTHMIQKALTFPTTFLPYPEKVGSIIHCSTEQVCPPPPSPPLSALLPPLPPIEVLPISSGAQDTTNRMGHRTGVSNFGRDLTHSPYNPGACICFGRGLVSLDCFELVYFTGWGRFSGTVLVLDGAKVPLLIHIPGLGHYW
ncbi:hypothetical protein BDW42DRAFT_123781 [Aspergillus taichungensis]|uniref:Uncharacterized protein n=1 Tax=Aspergillus taichungensis TaxID=482145 RepID=A0A2J5HR31_9EURO|nr:hypothetical protein BDW42DRAFT_123781 [Aspergillus taichungensis]